MVPSLLPFSVAEVVVVGLCLGLGIFLGVSIHHIITSPEQRWFQGAKMLLSLLCVASIGVVLFMLLAGINYHRTEFSELAGFDTEVPHGTYSAQELQDLGAFLVQEMTEARASIPDTTALYETTPDVFSHYASESVTAMKSLARHYPVFERPLYSPPKPVAFSLALSYANIAGIFFPFTMESNINTLDPLFTIPFTMAHELAHQAGFMREDEANFIAYLACRESSDPVVRYSGAYQAFVRTLPVLRKVDATLAAHLWEQVPPKIKEDNEYYRKFLRQFEGPVKEISTKVNDSYLKANSQHDGVAAYDRMVNLLLAWYAKQSTV